MAFTKTLLLLPLAFLLFSSMVSARELAQTAQESSQVDLEHHHCDCGGYGYGRGRGRGHGHGNVHGRYHKPGHGGHRPPSQTEEGN